MTITAEPGVRPARAARGRHWLRILWVPVLLVIASLAMGFTVTSSHGKALSPVDEWDYIDYLYKLPQEPVVPRGDIAGPETLSIISCDGFRIFGTMGAPCGTKPTDLSQYPQSAINTAAGYTPIFFWVTWAGAKAIQVVTHVDLVQAARYFGAFWLAGGVLMLWGLMRLFRVHPVAILAAGLALIASPYSWWTYTFVSTDAPSVLIGALTLFAAVKFARGQWSGWWLVAIAFVGTLVKVTHLLGAALAVLYLVIEFVIRRVREKRRGFEWRRSIGRGSTDGLLVFGVLAGLAAAVAQFGWRFVLNLNVVGPDPDQGVHRPLTSTALQAEFTNFLPNTIVANVSVGHILGLPVPGAIIAPLSWLTIAGVIGAFAIYRWRRPESSIVYAVGIGAVCLAPVLAIVLALTGGYLQLPSRYGGVLLPGMLLMLGLIAKNRIFVYGILGYSVFLYGYMILHAPFYG